MFHASLVGLREDESRLKIPKKINIRAIFLSLSLLLFVPHVFAQAPSTNVSRATFETVEAATYLEAPKRWEAPIKPEAPKMAQDERNTPDTTLRAIAYCESGGRQFQPDGSLLRGRVDSQDIGYLQINERYWLDIANQLGYNIYTLEGNIQMGEYILKHYGTKPWNASRNCWLPLVPETEKEI